MAKPPTVSILTYCAHPALAYGTLMVFKTLRVGFPTARVEVYDNGSHPEVREQIMAACAEVDADFTSMTPRHWSTHIAHQLLEREDDGAPLVLVDPDVAFWSSVEGWDFGGALMAGRLIAEMDGGSIVSRARLHPSMLWVPSLCRLRESLRVDEIPQRLERAAGRLELFDTLAVAHARLGDQCQAFTPEHLDCFDHLFFGSHLPAIDQNLSSHDTVIHRCHRAVAAGDLGAIRGAWREQGDYFAGRDVKPAIATQDLPPAEDLAEDERREVLLRLSARLRAPA